MVEWWRDLIAPTLSGLVVSGVMWYVMYKQELKKDESYQKKSLKNLIFSMKALLVELEDNSKGRGSLNYPFHFFWLQKVAENELFREKCPKALDKALKCISLSGAKQGVSPGRVQEYINELKEEIGNIISFFE